MPQVKQIGKKWFTQITPYPVRWWVLAEKSWTQEIDAPYRKGEGFIVKLPKKKGFVVGRWVTDGSDEQDALTSALNARPVTENDVLEENAFRRETDPPAEEDLQLTEYRTYYLD